MALKRKLIRSGQIYSFVFFIILFAPLALVGSIISLIGEFLMIPMEGLIKDYVGFKFTQSQRIVQGLEERVKELKKIEKGKKDTKKKNDQKRN